MRSGFLTALLIVCGCAEQQETQDAAAAAPYLGVAEAQALGVLIAADQAQLDLANELELRLADAGALRVSLRVAGDDGPALERLYALSHAGLMPSEGEARQRMVGHAQALSRLFEATPTGRALDLTYLCGVWRLKAALLEYLRSGALAHVREPRVRDEVESHRVVAQQHIGETTRTIERFGSLAERGAAALCAPWGGGDAAGAGMLRAPWPSSPSPSD
jgi:hypothetical protein